MCKLFAAALKVGSIFGLYCILYSTRDWVIDTQNAALDQSHLPGCISSNAAMVGRLPLPPCFGRVGSVVWRRPRWCSVPCLRVLQCCTGEGGASPVVWGVVIGRNRCCAR